MTAPPQTTLDPVGPQAARILALDRTYLAIMVAVFVLVTAALAHALFRHRAAGSASDRFSPIGQGPHRAIIAATALTTLILLVLLAASVATGKALNWGSAADTMVISVRGHMWWWQIEYLDPIPSKHVQDSNELHVPTGRPIKLELSSSDVIHSLWIPNVHGKTDLIPGHINTTVIQIDKPGEYRAQCAEFCGVEHAKMALVVIAHPPNEFDAWLNKARQIPPPPSEPVTQRGQQVFLRASCPLCHTIAGTGAQANVGPSLTSIGARKTLGAGTMGNSPGALAGWIVDPHGIKPGVNMPSNVLPGDDLNALVAYLGSLK